MKHKGSTSEFSEERNKDLMCVYRELLQKASYPINHPSILQELVNHKSKRFWVSSERATIVIADMMKGKTLEGMNETRIEMFTEIYRRVIAYRCNSKEVTRLPLIVEIIVNQEAPKFYLTPGSAKIIIHQIKKKKREWYEERSKLLRFLL